MISTNHKKLFVYLGADIMFQADPKTSSIVGREKVTEELKKIFEETLQGQLRVVLVRGEAGIGKTVVLNKLIEDLKDKAFIIRVKAQLKAHKVRYSGIIDMFDILQENEEIMKALENSYQNKPDNPLEKVKAVFSGELEIDHEDLIALINRVLTRIAEIKPLVLIFEDIQAAGADTLDTLLYILRESKQRRILFIGSQIPEELITAKGSKAEAALKNIQQIAKIIDLSPLTKEETKQTIEEMTKSKVSDVFIDFIYSHTRGNPYFVLALMSTLDKNGYITESNGTLSLKEGYENIDVPDEVRELILRRFNRLAQEDKDLLIRAAKVGDTFSYKDIAPDNPKEKLEILEHLRRLEEAGFIKPVGVNYEFSYKAIRKTLQNMD